MTRKIFNTLFLSLFAASTALAQQPLQSNVHIGLIYPISTNGVHAARYTNKVSLHAIAGVSYSELSFCASGIASIIKDSATGMVASGFANIIGNKAKGFQAAGFINYTRHYAAGFQAAGFINITGRMKGMQAAGFANIISSVTDTPDVAHADTSANAVTQVAGFVNVANNIHGTQLAGFANIAGEVKGAQVAGFINVADKVKGVQISGFINIADSSDYPIGLVNIIKNGEKALGVMTDETGTTFITFRSGGRVLYGIIAAGFNGSHNRDIYASQAGLGAHLPISRMFNLNGEAVLTSLIGARGVSDFQTGIRVLPSLRLWNVEIYAGPTFSYAYSSLPGAPFDHHSLWTETGYRHTNELYIGIQAGVQFYF